MRATSFKLESSIDPIPATPFPGQEADLVLLFGLRELIQEPLLNSLRAEFPNAQFAGCSTAGEMVGGNYVQNSVVVMAMCFDQARCKVSYQAYDDSDITLHAQAGLAAAGELAAADLKAVLFFGEGLGSDADAILDAMRSRFDEDGISPKLFGAKAGDNLKFEETAVVHQNNVSNQGLVAVGLYGEGLDVSGGTCTEWPLFEQKLEITSCDANAIHTIDGRPATEVYAEVLGGPAEEVLKDSGFHPLVLFNEEGQQLFARTLYGHDEKTGAVICAGNVQLGPLRIANLTSGSFEKGVEEVMSGLPLETAEAALVVSCVGRRLTLGSEVGREAAVIEKHVGSGLPLVGFYGYGEVGYCPHLEESHFLNHSFTAISLREG